MELLHNLLSLLLPSYKISHIGFHCFFHSILNLFGIGLLHVSDAYDKAERTTLVSYTLLYLYAHTLSIHNSLMHLFPVCSLVLFPHLSCLALMHIERSVLR